MPFNFSILPCCTTVQVEQMVHLVHFSPKNAHNDRKKVVFTLVVTLFLAKKRLI